MSQQIFSQATQAKASKKFMNVAENWVLYDTVLIGSYVSSMDYNTGYFATYAAMGGVTTIPFFNVRNRSHGLPYNNQDQQSQLPYVFKIYSVGISWWAPGTTTYAAGDPAIIGAQEPHRPET